MQTRQSGLESTGEITLRDLVKESLRMRPSRLIVGRCGRRSACTCCSMPGYRVVDSRFTGVPQRRRRVILLASATEDPRRVLFADDASQHTAGQVTGEQTW